MGCRALLDNPKITFEKEFHQAHPTPLQIPSFCALRGAKKQDVWQKVQFVCYLHAHRICRLPVANAHVRQTARVFDAFFPCAKYNLK